MLHRRWIAQLGVTAILRKMSHVLVHCARWLLLCTILILLHFLVVGLHARHLLVLKRPIRIGFLDVLKDLARARLYNVLVLPAVWAHDVLVGVVAFARVRATAASHSHVSLVGALEPRVAGMLGFSVFNGWGFPSAFLVWNVLRLLAMGWKFINDFALFFIWRTTNGLFNFNTIKVFLFFLSKWRGASAPFSGLTRVFIYLHASGGRLSKSYARFCCHDVSSNIRILFIDPIIKLLFATLPP